MKLFNKDTANMSLKGISLKNKEGKKFTAADITSRDKKLLIVIGILLLILISYYLVYRPLSARLAVIGAEKQAVDERVAEAKDNLANEAVILQGFETALANANTKAERFFPKVYPYKDRYVIMMENVVRASGATAVSIQFDDPAVSGVQLPDPNIFTLPGYFLSDMAAKINSVAQNQTAETAQSQSTSGVVAAGEQTNENELPKDAVVMLPATMQLQGSYVQIRAAIAAIERQNRAVAITGITLNEREATLTADFDLVFYAVEKVDNGADRFKAWTLNGTYGKSDIFN